MRPQHKVTGETDRRAARLPKLSECLQPAPPRLSLTQRQIVQIVGFSTLLAALAVGHVYLRFQIADIKVQHVELQRQREELFRQSMELERQNAALCNLPQLRQYALQQMQMIDSAVDKRQTTLIPAGLAQKYKTDAVTRAEMRPEPPKRAIERLLLTLTDMNRAFAGQK